MRIRSKSYRAIAAVLAGYTLLASGRALIPGLCATQAAVESRLATCCEAPPAATGGAPSLDAPPPETRACAFCNLAKGLAEPVARVAPPQPAFEDLASAPSVPLRHPQDPSRDTTRSRSPPAPA